MTTLPAELADHLTDALTRAAELACTVPLDEDVARIAPQSYKLALLAWADRGMEDCQPLFDWLLARGVRGHVAVTHTEGAYRRTVMGARLLNYLDTDGFIADVTSLVQGART
ncbi:hypothetical protein [Mycolicibacter arupensis]|uniref:Uncharacterized protein n=1 Tax=Mycolicibacter arupensis TaxID=342002 RepID=A0A5C7Y2C6_9MYCO|nr:hypothetical protein [Mycolicibacter arupensis]TXI55930.1 MAG: hypothetical protein E6Q54_11935 [Mycolicibacter arupensis]